MTALELYGIYAAAALIELYFFLMQRSARTIGRLSNLADRVAREMLPTWYLAVWPVKAVRWLLLIVIAINVGWLPAAVAWAALFLCTSFAPVPHRHFLPVFRRRVQKSLPEGNSAALLVALTKIEGKRLSPFG